MHLDAHPDLFDTYDDSGPRDGFSLTFLAFGARSGAFPQPHRGRFILSRCER
jgi:arginase family enzyme